MVSADYTVRTITVSNDNAIEEVIFKLSPDQLLKLIQEIRDSYSEQLYVESEARLCFNGSEFAVVDPTNTWRPLTDAECRLLLKRAAAANETLPLTALKDAIDCCIEKAKQPGLFSEMASEIDQLIKTDARKKRKQSLQATLQEFARTLGKIDDKSDLRDILSDVTLHVLLRQAEKYDEQRYDLFPPYLQQSISEIAYRWGKDGPDSDGDYKWKPLSVLDIRSIAVRAFNDLRVHDPRAALFSRTLSYIKSTLRLYEGYDSKSHIVEELGSIIEHLDLKRELFELQEADNDMPFHQFLIDGPIHVVDWKIKKQEMDTSSKAASSSTNGQIPRAVQASIVDPKSKKQETATSSKAASSSTNGQIPKAVQASIVDPKSKKLARDASNKAATPSNNAELPQTMQNNVQSMPSFLRNFISYFKNRSVKK